MKSVIVVFFCLALAVMAVTDEKKSFSTETQKQGNATNSSTSVSGVFSSGVPSVGSGAGVKVADNHVVSSTVKTNSGVRLACNTLVGLLPIAIGFLF